MSDDNKTVTEWRERWLDAFDMMRDNAVLGRQIGSDLIAQAQIDGDASKRLAGELVLAFADLRQGRRECAEAQLLALEAQILAHNERSLLVICLYSLALIGSSRGQYKENYEFAMARLLPLVQGQQTREAVRSLATIAVLAAEYNHPDEAMSHYFAALEGVRVLALPNWWVAHITTNIGEILCNSGNAEDALPMLTEAAEIALTCDKPWLRTYVLTNLALCRLALGEYADAYLAISDQVEEIQHTIAGAEGKEANISHCAVCICVAAYSLAKLARLDEAEQLLGLVMGRLEQFDETQHQCYIWWVCGHLHHQRGRLDVAITALLRAFEGIGDVDFDFMPLHLLHELSEIYAEQGNWRDALATHRKYHALFARAQGTASRVRLHMLHIRSELKEAETARRHAEATMAERRLLEESLKRSLAERDTILENSMVGIAFLNNEGRVQWANRAMTEIFAAPHHEYLGQSLERYYLSREEYLNAGSGARDAVRENRVFEAELRMRRADGGLFWAYLSGRAVDVTDSVRGTVWVVMDISKRRQLEEDLNKSEEQHRQVVDNSSEGIMVVQDGKIIFANPRMLQQTGTTREQFCGQHFVAIIHPEDRASVIDRHARRLRGEKIEQYYSFRSINYTNGNMVWLELSAVVIEWEGHPATLLFVTDITERKRLEDSLKQSLEEREIILENSMVGITLLNPDGRVKWANRPMVQMFCNKHANYVGRSLEEFYPSREEYLKTGTAVAAAVKKGNSYATELHMRREDGTQFWASLSGRAVKRRDLSHGTVWAVVDIDKRRQLEEDLLRSEERHRQVVDNVTEGILVEQDGMIVFANPSVAHICGRSLEELFTLPFLADVHPEDAAYFNSEQQRRAKGEECDKYYSFRIVHWQSNAIRWIELSSVIIDWEGRPASLAFLNDITERRHLEQSLKKSHSERVRLQTMQFQSELNEAEMARIHAEETTKAKSMFLANMSHEIRTPMNAIIGMAHLALCSQLNPKQRDYVEKIHAAGLSLLGIINDILDFSKIEAGKLNIEAVDFSLDKVLSNVSIVTSGKAQEKELEYLFQIPLDIPRTLVGDPLRLGQVLINLINNAIKFTEKGQVTVACRQRLVLEDKIELEFVVRDTGIGMSPAEATKLFQAFSQADGSTTRRYGGTGLGLSISKGMVELMNGKIWLDSGIGVGTNMYFTAWFGLPVMQEQRQTIPPEIEGMRILVVDDSPAARLVLAEILSALPVDVDFAFGGREALAAIRACDDSWPYGMVFADLEMPGLDGIELVSAVKGDVSLKSPPRMVLLSDHGREAVRYRPESVLIDAFLMRPVTGTMLLTCVEELFGTDEGQNVMSGQTVPNFRDLRVLLVEDNDINQQIASELMQAAGITVELAGNGRIGVEMLSAAGPEHFGLVFMDVQMPEMDGHEATQRIRGDKRFAALPIVAMTAHAMAEERDRCRASGMNDHLTKPINPAELYQMIARWCSARLNQAAPAVPLLANKGASNGKGEMVIEGFNVQEGLSRMMGDQDFYVELLIRFRDGQSEVAASIRRALAEDRKLAERQAHTLKGVAGMVGAMGMYALAAEIETAIRIEESEESLARRLDQLEHDMQTLLVALARFLEGQAQTAPPVAIDAAELDREAAASLILRFSYLLGQNDGEAIDLMENSSAMLESALGAEEYQRISRAAQRFDFDAALVALVKAAQPLGYALA